eukprot:593001-Pyramimonas_sp.AAC.1
MDLGPGRAHMRQGLHLTCPHEFLAYVESPRRCPRSLQGIPAARAHQNSTWSRRRVSERRRRQDCEGAD